ncbi:reprolysin-like metallopeptidase [Rubrivirga sp.]|uniref:reprolysin-like metallopeptidase n=1 Tax=Rubrivirga sp. TaxID=1885344 RepID=UPI003C739969
MLRTLALIALATASASSQPALWTDLPPGRAASRPDLETFRPVHLDLDAFRAVLEDASETASVRVPIPLPEGGVLEVVAVESPVLAPGLQARFPSIRTYAVAGSASGRIAVTPHGVSGVVYLPGGPVAFDPVGSSDDLEPEVYAVYRASSLRVAGPGAHDLEDDVLEGDLRPVTDDELEIGGTLRTLRLALATTGEFTQSRGGTIELGLAAATVSVNRVNALLERDLSVRLEIIEGNDRLVFLDGATDPFTATGEDLASEAADVFDDDVGAEQYDVGHLLTTGNSGRARIGAACTLRLKGEAFSGVGSESSLFDLYVFPHEIGHQLGARHSFSSLRDDEFNSFGVEPGVGHTLMAYPQRAYHLPDEERYGFAYHSESLRQMLGARWNRTDGCGSVVATGNDAPRVTRPHRISPAPLGAFFVLEGDATDASGTRLSYSWEQTNRYGIGSGPVPRFRSLDPGSSSSRTFPDLERALAGTLGPGEGLADRPGTYSFRLTVRDGAPGGGGVGTAVVEVPVYDDAGPFRVTSHERPVTHAPGSDAVVTWDPATFSSRVDQVDVSLSFDNGATWTRALEGALNTGTAVVPVPSTPTQWGRVMVRPVGRNYFAVGAAPFEIGPAPAAAVSDLEVEATRASGTRDELAVVITNVGAPGTSLDVSASLHNVQPAPAQDVGYQALWSDETGGPDVAFVDISDTGSRLQFVPVDPGSLGDEATAEVALPFSFSFYGVAYDSLHVTSNGLVLMGPCSAGKCRSGFTHRYNSRIPLRSTPNGFVAPFWEDLHLQSGAVFTGLRHDGRFVIQYDRIGRPVGDGDYTFQVLLSPRGRIEIQYGQMENVTAGSTIGIEGATGETGVLVAYNELLALSGTALSFAPPRDPWLVLGRTSQTLARGESADLPLLLDLGAYQDGEVLTADLVIVTNDGARPRVVVPIEVTVGTPVATGSDLEAARVSSVRPNPSSRTAHLDVTLAAPGPLRVSIYDALGRLVSVPFESAVAGTLEVDLEAGTLAPGLYVARVQAEGGVESRTFVVAR